MQERLLPHVDGALDVVRNTSTLIRFAGIVGIPVILSEQEKLGESVDEILAVGPATDVFRKTAFGCLECREFKSRVNDFGRKNIVIAGVETHICVAQTALQALGDFNVHVVADATSSRNPANKKIGLDRVRQAGGVITSTEMFMYELLQRADRPEFKPVLQLVKSQNS